MSTFSIIAEKPVTMAELKEELIHVKERDGELNFRAQKTEEYLAQFIDTKKAKALELLQKLTDLNIPRIKPEQLIKIVDILPTTAEEVKAIMTGYTLVVSNENCTKITEIINEYMKK